MSGAAVVRALRMFGIPRESAGPTSELEHQMTIRKPRNLAALLALTVAAACGGGQEGSAADSPAAATTGAPADTGVRPMNMMDSASSLPADSLKRLDSAAAHAGHATTPADTTKRP